MDQRKRLVQLRQDWTGCKGCALCETRASKNIVFGAGSSSAEFFFLYDVPTEDDEFASSPMYGEHGALLSDLMMQAGIDKSRSYCTPIIGCRPTVVIPATEDQPERIAERTPVKEEIDACRQRVHDLIYAVDPRVIFAVGDVAWKYLVRTKDRAMATTIDKARGDIFVARMPGLYAHEITYPVIPLLSMKQIMQNPSAAKVGPLTLAIKDMSLGRTYVEYLKSYEAKDLKASK